MCPLWRDSTISLLTTRVEWYTSHHAYACGQMCLARNWPTSRQIQEIARFMHQTQRSDYACAQSLLMFCTFSFKMYACIIASLAFSARTLISPVLIPCLPTLRNTYQCRAGQQPPTVICSYSLVPFTLISVH